jgi:hypothetical protein
MSVTMRAASLRVSAGLVRARSSGMASIMGQAPGGCQTGRGLVPVLRRRSGLTWGTERGEMRTGPAITGGSDCAAQPARCSIAPGEHTVAGGGDPTASTGQDAADTARPDGGQFASAAVQRSAHPRTDQGEGVEYPQAGRAARRHPPLPCPFPCSTGALACLNRAILSPPHFSLSP